MSLRDIVQECTPNKLRTFAGLQFPFFCFIAWLQPAERWAPTVILTALAISATVAVTGLCKPTWIRPIYLLWMVAVYPIRFLISHLSMAIIYYGIITPIGLYRRHVHGDPMQRNFKNSTDNSTETYWEEVPQPKPDTYFRQF